MINSTLPPRMDPTVKKMWVAALRSGAFRQGRGALKQPDPHAPGVQYCVNGVLCELAVAAGAIKPARTFALGSSRGYSYGGYTGTLPDAVVAWSGMVRPYWMSHLNDTAEMGFLELADWIEENL